MSASGEVYVCRATENIVTRNSLLVRPKYLNRFGWQEEMGPPRWRISLGEEGGALSVNSEDVMVFNKHGRDGYPMKAHWVGMIVKTLNVVSTKHELVFRLLRIDDTNLMHIHLSVRKRARCTTMDTSFKSDTTNETVERSCLVDNDYDEDEDEDDEAISRPHVCVKRQRTYPIKYKCKTCDLQFAYLNAFRKHVAHCGPLDHPLPPTTTSTVGPPHATTRHDLMAALSDIALVDACMHTSHHI